MEKIKSKSKSSCTFYDNQLIDIIVLEVSCPKYRGNCLEVLPSYYGKWVVGRGQLS